MSEAEVSQVVSDANLHLFVRPWWVIWAGMHWGFRRHACVLWCCAGTVDAPTAREALGVATFHPINVVIFYRELLVQLVPEKELAQMIVDAMPIAERKHMRRFYAGKQAFEAGSGRRTIAQLFGEVFKPNYLPRLRESDDSEESRIADGRLFAEGLRQTISLRSDNPPLRPPRIPMILIHQDCANLIETIPALESDSKNPEDTKFVDNEQDSIWEAARTCFREYPNIVGSLPAHIRRQQAIDKGETPMQRFLNAIEYDHKNNPRRITKRR